MTVVYYAKIFFNFTVFTVLSMYSSLRSSKNLMAKTIVDFYLWYFFLSRCLYKHSIYGRALAIQVRGSLWRDPSVLSPHLSPSVMINCCCCFKVPPLYWYFKEASNHCLFLRVMVLKISQALFSVALNRQSLLLWTPKGSTSVQVEDSLCCAMIPTNDT